MADRKTKKYIDRLTAIYAEIPGEKMEKADLLISKGAELLMMMDECRKHTDQEGCVSEMRQGNYSIMRENPWSKVYDSKHKLLLSTLDKLDKLLPDQGSKRDELVEFLDAGGA